MSILAVSTRSHLGATESQAPRTRELDIDADTRIVCFELAADLNNADLSKAVANTTNELEFGVARMVTTSASANCTPLFQLAIRPPASSIQTGEHPDTTHG